MQSECPRLKISINNYLKGGDSDEVQTDSTTIVSRNLGDGGYPVLLLLGYGNELGL
jgi:hypothetical protein